VIDPVTNTVVGIIHDVEIVHGVASAPDGTKIYLSNESLHTLDVVDGKTLKVTKRIKLSGRPNNVAVMTFDTNPDGSTKHIFVQLSNYHGFAVVDFATGKEIRRIEHPPIPGEHAHTDGLQGAPAHGLGVTPDGRQLWSTSKVYSHAYVYSLPDLKPIGTVFVGQHPEWVTFTPDGRFVYIGAAGDNMTFAVDTKTLKEVARIPVGQVPKRIGTAILQTN
jgi:YVTN family beta-propeller protein